MLLIFLYPPWHLLLLFWPCHTVADGMELTLGPFAHALWSFACLLGKTLPAFVAVLFAFLLCCESIHYVLYILYILLEKEILSRLTGNCDSVWVWSAWKCLCYFVYTFLTKQWKTFTVWTQWLWVVQWSFETLLVTKLICQTHSPFFSCLSLDSTKPRFLVQLLLSGNQQGVVVEAQKSGRWRQDSVFCSSKSWSPYVSIGSIGLLKGPGPSSNVTLLRVLKSQ